MAGKEKAGQAPASIRLREAFRQYSYNGLRAIAGVITEECNRDLQWPQCINTYKDMMKDATISSTLVNMEMQVTKVPWKIKVPTGKEEQLKAEVEFLEQCMEDMDHTWTDFIRRAFSANRFGFAPVEKVYRYRKKGTGSRFRDGKIGIASLPLIDQDTVAGWNWDESGRKLTGLYQYHSKPTGRNSLGVITEDKKPIEIRRAKFMNFRTDPMKDNPEGNSPLKSVYVAWRYKTEYERQEALGVSTDVRGLKVFSMPVRYMSAHASEDEKATFDFFKNAISQINRGESEGVLLPLEYDENGNKLFDFDVKSVLGTSTYNVSEIIQRYRKEIVTGLLAPMMILGQDGSGSFALAESLEGITRTVIEARLTEIKDVLNKELIPQLFELNGFSLEVLPFFDFDFSGQESLEELSKYVQRIAAVGLLPRTAEMVNFLTRRMGVDPQIPVNSTQEEMLKLLTGNDSRSGDGMEEGTSGDGTSKTSGGRDNSTANKEN